MKHVVRTAAVAAFAFAFGLLAARLPLTANAAGAPLTATAIDLAAMTPATLPPPTAAFPNLQSKTVLVTDGTTAALQMGNAARHYHSNADEIQIVLEGAGTEVLGTQTVVLKPGTMVVIPRGTNHAAFTETSGHLKWVSFKTPPQAPDDIHYVP